MNGKGSAFGLARWLGLRPRTLAGAHAGRPAAGTLARPMASQWLGRRPRTLAGAHAGRPAAGTLARPPASQSPARCQACGHDGTRFYAEIKGSRVVACTRCGFHYLHPLPFADPGELYGEFYESWGQGWWQWEQGSERQFRWIVAELRKRVPAGYVYDVGCGSGWFLKLCREAGYEVGGCELSGPGATRASELLGVDIPKAPVEAVGLAPGSVDVISLNNVLEHLVAPADTLRMLYAALRPGGLVTVSVPNLTFGKLVRAVSRPLTWVRLPDPSVRVAVWHVPAHLSFFTPRTLTRTLETAGFEAVEIYNEVPVRNPGTLKNLAKAAVYRSAELVRRLSAGRVLLGHGLTAFARKPAGGRA